jgi:hypothetical protein
MGLSVPKFSVSISKGSPLEPLYRDRVLWLNQNRKLYVYKVPFLPLPSSLANVKILCDTEFPNAIDYNT